LTRFRDLRRRILRKKSDVALVAVWTTLVALVVIQSYLISYSSDPFLAYTKPAYPWTGGLTIGLPSILIVAVSGIIAGLFLSDVKEMIYGYIAVTVLSFIVDIIFVSFYIWYALEWGPSLSSGFNWEWAPFLATEVVFNLTFPYIMITGLISLVIGAFLKEWIS
jgi:hypothetical protein